MTGILDLDPPARQIAALLDGVTDEHLTRKTPCEEYVVGDLLDHMMGLTLAFREAATKSTGKANQAGPARPSAANLDPEWRSILPGRLEELVAAWRDPAAWEGTTEAGGATLPAEVMGMVVIDELVLHGWDLARGTGQHFACDPASTQVCFEFTTMSAAPGEEAGRQGLFGPIVEVPADAPLLDRALGLSGRDPDWTA